MGLWVGVGVVAFLEGDVTDGGGCLEGHLGGCILLLVELRLMRERCGGKVEGLWAYLRVWALG